VHMVSQWGAKLARWFSYRASHTNSTNTTPERAKPHYSNAVFPRRA
jgi:hypothetical protein